MNVKDLKNLVKDIVTQADRLKRTFVHEPAPVNYVCIFSHSDKEYVSLLKTAKQIGTVVKETHAGPIFQIAPVSTVAGAVQVVKIRIPDTTPPERGDADFTLAQYDEFKKTHLAKNGFKLIERDEFEMIELMDPDYAVRVYFSNPPLDKQLGITQ